MLVASAIIIGILMAVLSEFLVNENKLKINQLNFKVGISFILTNIFLYSLISLQKEHSILLVQSCFLSSLLLVIGYVDYRTKYVYRITILLGYFIGMILLIIQVMQSHLMDVLIDSTLGALLGFIFIQVIMTVTNAMGEGDRDIATVCGFFLGLQGSFITLFLAFIIGAIVSLMLMMIKKISSQEEIAFGPFLAAGGIMTLLYQEQLVEVYLKIFGLV